MTAAGYTDAKGYKTPDAPTGWPFGRSPLPAPAPIQDAPF